MSIILKPYIGINYTPLRNTEDLFKGFLPARGLGFLVGEPGVGKSFLAQKICGSLSTRTSLIHESHIILQKRPDTGNATGTYASLYLAGEREDGLLDRQKALVESFKKDYGLTGFEMGLPIITCAIRGHSYETLKYDIPVVIKKERKELESLGYPLRLIVLDTLQSALNVPNENGNTEMQYVMNGLRNLADALECFILIITHPAQVYGKGASYALKGVPRGASSMRGTADIIWYMEKVGSSETRKLTVTKGSEGYCEGESFFFTLTPYAESAALVPTEAPPEKKYESKDNSSTEITSKDLGVLKAMEHTYRKHGYVVGLYEELNIQAVTRGNLHTTLKELHTQESEKEKKQPIGDSAIGNRITRAMERLLASELIRRETLDNEEIIYYPAKPWSEMQGHMNSKYKNLNFSKITFL